MKDVSLVVADDSQFKNNCFKYVMSNFIFLILVIKLINYLLVKSV